MTKIRKLVIPVAGLGTRFLPATKAQPKEMMPIVDKPIIQYVVEDAVRSGITDVIMVTGPSKRAVEDHFSPNYELVNLLKKQGKNQIAEEIKKISDLANFIFIRQKGPYGNGSPVLSAKEVIGDEPFAVMWGDEFFYAPRRPQLKQLMDVFDKYGDPVLTACQTDAEGTRKYGIIDGQEVAQGVLKVKRIIEKPGPQKAPTKMASLGGFILTPDIFEELQKTKLGKGGELWLVDAIFALSKKRSIYACVIDGQYYDTGSKFGYLKANLDFSLRDPELRNDVKKYLKQII
ncbi:MAG: UTP--glucose-1-phosphate uridylyltransferase [Candidatus Magasanikbacteria bacterium CG10_big_fil_rev_8_21_14_0_10_40_10]|uniref:UTP--glucose-1-phosphate uridylyltransferase n=1 Tax=Candidatus Magasanikbacteria bacterium CG10_big_fil_rev_8_21_14_0_10_40_10 TaxID=1974648 RepID=A0A2M6W2N5_9BACT|nr:MAG: UTP--glucose-1-phosphate uridylyltransferase [Candidatus Magasanikbacteria bacterium CG10_big_fil_rev_8_21_14_0_10_40_10]